MEYFEDDYGKQTYVKGLDGGDYTHFVNADNTVGKYGWRMGNWEGVYDGSTVLDYLITDGVRVIRCEGIELWEVFTCEDEVAGLFEEWKDMIAQGYEGYTQIV